MKAQAQVRIVSGGDYTNTRVFIDDVELRCVKAVSWRIGPEPGLATATLDVVDVAVELGGTLPEIRVVQRLASPGRVRRGAYRLRGAKARRQSAPLGRMPALALMRGLKAMDAGAAAGRLVRPRARFVLWGGRAGDIWVGGYCDRCYAHSAAIAASEVQRAREQDVVIAAAIVWDARRGDQHFRDVGRALDELIARWAP